MEQIGLTAIPDSTGIERRGLAHDLNRVVAETSQSVDRPGDVLAEVDKRVVRTPAVVRPRGRRRIDEYTSASLPDPPSSSSISARADNRSAWVVLMYSVRMWFSIELAP
jgi:hypothetical protein